MVLKMLRHRRRFGQKHIETGKRKADSIELGLVLYTLLFGSLTKRKGRCLGGGSSSRHCALGGSIAIETRYDELGNFDCSTDSFRAHNLNLLHEHNRNITRLTFGLLLFGLDGHFSTGMLRRHTSSSSVH